MKIAVITYHYSNNKGAIMQTYGLCRYLKEKGHDVEIIDIRQNEWANQPLYIKIIKYFVWNYRMTRDVKRYYPPLTHRYSTMEELRQNPPKADCYIVGSDQVWNPNISKDLCLAYFLDFGEASVKRISYASSFGLSNWTISDNSLNETIKSLLHNFSSLSVREDEGAELAMKEFGVKPQVVLDPTFLNDNYLEFGPYVEDSGEIVCYKLNKTRDFWDNINIVSDALGKPILLLNYNFPKKKFKYCFPPSLRTWMQKLASATFIITDSFHGVAFSIINRRQFVAILNHNDRDSRLITLTKKMHLEHRLYQSVADMVADEPWENQINYLEIEDLIKNEVTKSRQFLDEALRYGE